MYDQVSAQSIVIKGIILPTETLRRAPLQRSSELNTISNKFVDMISILFLLSFLVSSTARFRVQPAGYHEVSKWVVSK